MTTRYKAGSRVQAVWEMFESKGGQAAYEHGLQLQPKPCQPSTLRGWISAWAKETGKGNNLASTSTRTPRSTNGIRTKLNKEIVTVTWKGMDPDADESKCYLMQEGPEQSWLKWVVSGTEQAIGNSQWKRTTPEPTNAGMKRMQANMGNDAAEAIRKDTVAMQHAALADVRFGSSKGKVADAPAPKAKAPKAKAAPAAKAKAKKGKGK